MTPTPFTPPLELLREWCAHNSEHENYEQFWHYIAAQAAQWGSDQELEACCEWLHWQNLATHSELIPSLRAARRPKPSSLKEEAMQALCRFMAREGHDDCTEEEIEDDFNAIRRALEALDD